METNSNNIPYNQLPGFEQTNRLTQMVQQAYFRRNRQLPVNIAEIVECLKGDILKHLGGIPTDKLDLAITTATLDNDQPLSEAFFFAAAKKAWYQPKTNTHPWDDDGYRRPDLEGDTISLLDTCAAMLRRDTAEDPDLNKPLKRCVALPAFNPICEYDYLVMRGQLAVDAWTHHFADALLAVNTERMDSHHHRLTKEEAAKNPDVLAQARRLAVLDWLQSCNTIGVAPSAILAPLANEAQYAQLRRTV